MNMKLSNNISLWWMRFLNNRQNVRVTQHCNPDFSRLNRRETASDVVIRVNPVYCLLTQCTSCTIQRSVYGRPSHLCICFKIILKSNEIILNLNIRYSLKQSPLPLPWAFLQDILRYIAKKEGDFQISPLEKVIIWINFCSREGIQVHNKVFYLL